MVILRLTPTLLYFHIADLGSFSRRDRESVCWDYEILAAQDHASHNHACSSEPLSPYAFVAVRPPQEHDINIVARKQREVLAPTDVHFILTKWLLRNMLWQYSWIL